MLSAPSAAFAAPPERPPSFITDQAEWQKLRSGGVIVNNLGGKIPAAEAKILIPRSADVVREVVSDPMKIMKNESKVKSLKLISKNGNTQLLEYTVMLGKMLPTFNYVLRHQQTSPDNIHFKRVSGSFKDFEGNWKVQPVDGGNTILTYKLKLDPGPGLPSFLIGSLIRADLPRMMQNAKSAVMGE